MAAMATKDERTAVHSSRPVRKGKSLQNIRAVLVALEGDEAGTRYELARDYMEIGRAGDADIRIPRQDISRRHCLIFFKRDRFFIRDLESTNGTFLNGARIDEMPLTHGDTIQLGESTFQFVLEEKTKSRRVWDI